MTVHETEQGSLDHRYLLLNVDSHPLSGRTGGSIEYPLRLQAVKSSENP